MGTLQKIYQLGKTHGTTAIMLGLSLESYRLASKADRLEQEKIKANLELQREIEESNNKRFETLKEANPEIFEQLGIQTKEELRTKLTIIFEALFIKKKEDLNDLETLTLKQIENSINNQIKLDTYKAYYKFSTEKIDIGKQLNGEGRLPIVDRKLLEEREKELDKVLIKLEMKIADLIQLILV